MILEVADIRITPGRNADFETAIARGLETVLPRATGYIAHQVQRGIESPDRYLLMIWWHTIENHVPIQSPIQIVCCPTHASSIAWSMAVAG